MEAEQHYGDIMIDELHEGVYTWNSRLTRVDESWLACGAVPLGNARRV